MVSLREDPSSRLQAHKFHNTINKSSHPEVFCKKSVLKTFAKLTRKHLCRSFFFNKVASLRPAILFKKRLQYSCFPVNFAKFSRTLFFNEHLWWLLLIKLRKLIPMSIKTSKISEHGYYISMLWGRLWSQNLWGFCDIYLIDTFFAITYRF